MFDVNVLLDVDTNIRLIWKMNGNDFDLIISSYF